MSIRVHKRAIKVERADTALRQLVDAWQAEHGLTYIETVQCLTAVIQSISKYALRRERHPRNPDKGADEE